MNSLQNIEKLTGENYIVWKIHMKSVLINSDLWAYVSGSKTVSEDASAEGKTTWKTNDEKALATILLGISASQLIHVKNCVHSKEAWDKLEHIYKPRGPSRKVTLFKQLLQQKIKPPTKMCDHLNIMCEINEKLLQIDVTIPDALLSITLLCSLPDSYENFVVAVESQDRLPSFINLKSKILEEDNRRCEKEPEEERQHVLYGKSKNFAKDNRRPKYKLTVKCYTCGKEDISQQIVEVRVLN